MLPSSSCGQHGRLLSIGGWWCGWRQDRPMCVPVCGLLSPLCEHFACHHITCVPAHPLHPQALFGARLWEGQEFVTWHHPKMKCPDKTDHVSPNFPSICLCLPPSLPLFYPSVLLLSTHPLDLFGLNSLQFLDHYSACKTALDV